MAAGVVAPKATITAVVAYALSSIALACSLLYVPYGAIHPLTLLISSFLPLIFLVPYVRFLLQSATYKQRLLALALNGSAGFWVAGYVWARPDWPPPPELEFRVAITGSVVAASIFVLATLALLFRHRTAFIAGTAAALVIWPCLLQALLSSQLVGILGLEHLGGMLAFLGFALAVATLFLRPGFAYCTGFLASALALPYMIGRELSYPYYGNSWVTLNLPADRFSEPVLTYARLSILSVVLVSISTMLSLLRLCPDNWTLRNRPVRSRTWPAFALSIFVVAAWFAHSVTPYRVPTEHGGVTPEISVIHIEKRGLHLTETRVSVMRDGRLYLSDDIRKPLRYESEGEMFEGHLSSWDKSQHILDFVRSVEFKALKGSSKRELPRNWNSDTWYVYGERVPFVAFSSASNTAPPRNSLTGSMT